MGSVVTYLVVIGTLFLVAYFHSKRSNKTIEEATQLMKLVLDTSFDGNYDIKVVENQMVTSDDIHYNTNALSVHVVEKDVKKGYDFMVVEHGVGYISPQHSHVVSDELFFIISGSLNLTMFHRGGINTVVLNAGDSFYVPHGVQHQLHIPDICKFITVAKPPLLSRNGSINGWLNKLKK